MSTGGNERKRLSSLSPFVVECGDDGNRQIPLDHFKMWLRGWWRQSNIKCDMGPDMRKMPDTPGIHLEIKPRDMTLRIFDPLSLPKNAGLLARINVVVDEITSIKTGTGRKLGPMQEVTHKLDADLMKSVLLEISRKVHGPSPVMSSVSTPINAVQGTVPVVEDLLVCEGRELNDPWSNSPVKAKYVDQREAFQDRFERFLMGSEAVAQISG